MRTPRTYISYMKCHGVMRGDNVSGIVNKIKRSRRDVLRFLSMKRDMEAGYGRLSYSQEGEDLIVATLLEYVRRGSFVVRRC